LPGEPAFDLASVPAIVTLSPAYKVYENTSAASLDASAGEAIPDEQLPHGR